MIKSLNNMLLVVCRFSDGQGQGILDKPFSMLISRLRTFKNIPERLRMAVIFPVAGKLATFSAGTLPSSSLFQYMKVSELAYSSTG